MIYLPVCKTKLHVIADDFGSSIPVDEAVIRCWKEGILTGASIIANGATSEEAFSFAQNQHLPLGIHVNLVQGRTLTDAAKVSTLLGKDGLMHGSAWSFFRAYWKGKINPAEISMEANAQVQWMLERDLTPIHIDSHQHIHLWPSILPIFLDIAVKYNIRRIRLASLPPEFTTFNPIRWLKYATLCYFGCRGRKKSILAGISVTDHLWGLAVTGMLEKKYVLSILPKMNKGEHELFCHPSLVNEEKVIKSWQHRGAEETTALTSPEVKELIQKLEIHLLR